MKTIAKLKETIVRRRQISKHYRAIQHMQPRMLADIGLDPERVALGIKAHPWK